MEMGVKQKMNSFGESPTTIQVKRDTKYVLEKMKVIDRESFDNVIRRALSRVLDMCEEGMDAETRKLIRSRIEEVHGGRVISTKELREKLFRNKKGESVEDNDIRNCMD